MYRFDSNKHASLVNCYLLFITGPHDLLFHPCYLLTFIDYSYVLINVYKVLHTHVLIFY